MTDSWVYHHTTLIEPNKTWFNVQHSQRSFTILFMIRVHTRDYVQATSQTHTVFLRCCRNYIARRRFPTNLGLFIRFSCNDRHDAAVSSSPTPSILTTSANPQSVLSSKLSKFAHAYIGEISSINIMSTITRLINQTVEMRIGIPTPNLQFAYISLVGHRAANTHLILQHSLRRFDPNHLDNTIMCILQILDTPSFNL